MGEVIRTVPASDKYPGFWDKVGPTRLDGCWPWTGYLAPNGYGRYKNSSTHRIAVLLSGRDIPEGLVVDHICRNRACCNPEHLRVVTRGQNTLENSKSLSALNRSKTECVRGHAFTPENTYSSGGRRYCRACQIQRKRDRRRLLRHTAHGQELLMAVVDALSGGKELSVSQLQRTLGRTDFDGRSIKVLVLRGILEPIIGRKLSRKYRLLRVDVSCVGTGPRVEKAIRERLGR